MKFAKQMQVRQKPEWSNEYVNYTKLKELILEIDSILRQNYKEGDLDLVKKINNLINQFQFLLQDNLKRVDQFYNMEISRYYFI